MRSPLPPMSPRHFSAALFGLLLLACIALGGVVAAAARYMAHWLPL